MYSLLNTELSECLNKCKTCKNIIFAGSDHEECRKCGKRSPDDADIDVDSPIHRILSTYSCYCKHNCGTFGQLSLLKDHEPVCSKRSRQAVCYINDCDWRGSNQELVDHATEYHKDQVIIHADHRFEDIKIGFNNPVKLLLLFDQNYHTNEMFWITLYQANGQRYILVKSYGNIKLQTNRINNLEMYTVKSGGISIKSAVKQRSLDAGDHDNLQENMLSEGTNITALEGLEYQLHISSKDSRNDYLKDKTIMNELECKSCSKLMAPPIMMCSSGHSICKKCSKEVAQCPVCQMACNNTRNYALEAIANKIETLCPFTYNGCVESFLPQLRSEHVEYCLYRPTQCLFEDCTWKGSVVQILHHFLVQHPSNVINNGEIDVIKETGNYPCVMSAFDNLFVIKYKVSDEDMRFTFTHWPFNSQSKFNVELKILNGNCKVVWATTMQCMQEDIEFSDPRVFCRIAKNLYELICDDKYQINYVVNVFRSLHDQTDPVK